MCDEDLGYIEQQARRREAEREQARWRGRAKEQEREARRLAWGAAIREEVSGLEAVVERKAWIAVTEVRARSALGRANQHPRRCLLGGGEGGDSGGGSRLLLRMAAQSIAILAS